ncbi:neuronal acetylcholine receptor subunit alpha-10 [Hyalella azteca]|uniref:Neuronal acetylcholine receptor subunit alpha-10 n=1 Tax=Hyalella azteca TaxID=294128 RepID=A0A8B7PDZ4_HYAAZ|nr:neuronal acetylcholine receptor subunit alpha-10 [Hyalella azteca]
MSAASFISYKFSKADLRNGVPPTRVLATKTTINKRNNSLSGSTFSYHRISCTSLHRLLLVVFCATLLLTGTRADELEYRLTRYLMANYDPSVRPAHNSSEPLSVVFGLSLHSIIDVDEKNQILTTNCWLTQVWIDAHLIWNASDFGGISVIRVPYDKVWKPDIILYNNADAQYSASTINTNVIVKSNGEVTWLSHGIYRSSCEMNVEYFPFDVQSCKMKWSSWTYDGYQLDLAQQMEEGDMSNYKPNGEFDLDAFTSVRTVAIYSCCPEPYPDITYTILLRRRPMFYVFNLILPCLLINGIALLVFYVPSESGEKVTLGISALLSMTVFLITIRESLPPTEKTPLISLYYGVTICLVTLASALSVLTLNLHHRGLRGVEVPPLARKIILGWGAKFVLLNFKDSEAQAKAKLRSGGSRDTEKFQMHDLDPMEHMERFSHFDPFSVSPHFSPRHRLNHSSNDLIHAHSTGPTSPIMGTSAEMTEFEQQFLRVLRKVQQTIDKNETRLSDQDRREAIKDEWQRVSMVLDRALLLCFVLATSVATSCILLSSPHGP